MQSILIAAALALGAAVPMSQAIAAGTAQQPVKKSLSAPEVVRHYGTLVHANYADSIASAKTMRRAIQAFLSAPSEQGLQRARQAWIDAREYYGQTEAFRFYAGPIDNDDGPEGQINAWPMDESYVDYVEGNPDAGIINNRKEAITKKRLAELNEHDGE